MEMTLKELDLKEMGSRVRKQREFLKMTRENLAACLGVSGKFISDIEYGIKGVSIKNLYTLTQVLEISADYLLTGKAYTEREQRERNAALEGIFDALRDCTAEQLRCMEQIAKFYVKALHQE